ncbi:MAG: hypothetical protein ACI8Y3_001666 [Paraglaciecola sp.]|jgi:hypothetical protein
MLVIDKIRRLLGKAGRVQPCLVTTHTILSVFNLRLKAIGLRPRLRL